MRLLALVALALLALPAVAQVPQGEEVDVVAVRAPTVVVVDHPFPVSVDLANRATGARSVQMYTFLYQHEAGKTCGSHTDPRFLGRADRGAVPSLTIQAGRSTTYPAEGALPWWHMVNASQVPGPGRYQLCVVAYKPDGTQGLLPYDQGNALVDVRSANGLPDVDFTWSPGTGNVTTEFRFEAVFGDDPEGDPLAFAWEFGHLTTSGLAVDEGPVVTHSFFHFSPSPKQYEVNLTVSDGFDSLTVRKVVTVLPEGTPAPQRYEGGPAGAPWWAAIPGTGALLVLVVTALARRARSR